MCARVDAASSIGARVARAACFAAYVFDHRRRPSSRRPNDRGSLRDRNPSSRVARSSAAGRTARHSDGRRSLCAGLYSLADILPSAAGSNTPSSYIDGRAFGLCLSYFIPSDITRHSCRLRSVPSIPGLERCQARLDRGGRCFRFSPA